MRERDREAVSAYRQALSAIDNAEAVALEGTQHAAGGLESAPVGVGSTDVTRRSLSGSDAAGILAAEIAEHDAAAAVIAGVDASRAAEHRRAATLLRRLQI